MIDVYQIDGGPSGVYFEMYHESYDRDNYIKTCYSVQDVLKYADEVADDFTVHTFAKWYKENE